MKFNLFSKNWLANRLGVGIKRNFEVPKPLEGCSFLEASIWSLQNANSDLPTPLLLCVFDIFNIRCLKMSNSPRVWAHGRVLGPLGGALAALGGPSGILWVTLGCLWGLWGPPGGGLKASTGPLFQKSV